MLLAGVVGDRVGEEIAGEDGLGLAVLGQVEAAAGQQVLGLGRLEVALSEQVVGAQGAGA